MCPFAVSRASHLIRQMIAEVITERCHSSLSKPHQRSDNGWKRKDKDALSLNHCLDEIQDLQSKVVGVSQGSWSKGIHSDSYMEFSYQTGFLENYQEGTSFSYTFRQCLLTKMLRIQTTDSPIEITLGICELKGGIFHQPIHPIQNLLLSGVPQDTDCSCIQNLCHLSQWCHPVILE